MPNFNHRRLAHFYLPDQGRSETFTSPLRGRSKIGSVPARNRAQHAEYLELVLSKVIRDAEIRVRERNPDITAGKLGYYLEFDVPTSQQAVVEKLENRQGRDSIELVTVRKSIENSENVTATVFVPNTKRDHYLKKVRDYAEKDNITYEKDEIGDYRLDDQGGRIEKSRRPKNEELVNAIDDIRLAQMRSLYTDDMYLYPTLGQETWWEVWIRSGCRTVFEHAANVVGVQLKDHLIEFAERDVMLACGIPEQIAEIIANTDAIAELRLARDTPALFMEMDGTEQREWNDDLADRIVSPSADAPAVCILDSGSTIRHPLIRPALAPEDQQEWKGRPLVEDVSHNIWGGHGTQLSGIALYGDLMEALVREGQISLEHRLESVKILPDRGENDPDLYGFITASAVSRTEIQAPARRRAFCLAVTCDAMHWRGRPSSWSAKIDELIYGEGNVQRLITVSAGNIRTSYSAAEFLDQNDTSGIESPAQAWNALTVGAMTEKCTITNSVYADWPTIGRAGDLSPLSRTSVPWIHDWPLKPDVVFEGGNQVENPATGRGDYIDDLGLLTTFRRPEERLFTVTSDTSAATAQIARMAAQIMADRPSIWPETVRALIVQSAEWNDAMLTHLPVQPKKNDYRILLRRYGYGIPNLSRAIRSNETDVTLVIEREITPFRKDGSYVKSGELVVHELPWPRERLAELNETHVELRVTLSYYIEPNPGERGWTKRHSYPSHGLRFAFKRPEENMNQFLSRINKADQDGDKAEGGGTDNGWLIGPNLRNRGSLHSDIWHGTAIDLSQLYGVAVHPVGGWWKEKPALKRTERRVRYALVLTLRVSVVADLYSEIASQVGVEVEVAV